MNKSTLKHFAFVIGSLLTLNLSTGKAVGTAAGTIISNTGYLDSIDDANNPVVTPSNPVNLTVQHVPVIRIITDTKADGTPGQVVEGVPGQDGVLPYVLSNPSNGTDTYNLSVISGNSNTDASKATIYLDTNGDGKYDAGDTAATTATLPADGSTTFFVVYPIPADSNGNTVYLLNPQGVSQTDNTVTDTNNLGAIDTQDVLGLNLTKDEQGTVTSPGTIVYTHTLSNTGNIALTPNNTALAVGSNAGGWTYSYSVDNAAAGNTPQQALSNWNGSLAPGASIPVKVTVTAPAGLAGGTTDTTSITAATTTPSSAEVNNTTLTPIQVNDVTTVTKGVGNTVKSVQTCGTDTTCAAPSTISGDQVKPSEIIQYSVVASNTGNGGLKRPVVRDSIPANTTGVNWNAQISGQTGGKLMYSLDNATWSNNPQSINNAAAGTNIYVGYDSNNDNTVDNNDILNPAAVITLKLSVKIN